MPTTRTDAINSSEMLILLIRWADGEVSLDEFVKSPKQLVMSYEDVQHRIDSIVTDKRSVVAVKRLDVAENHVEDISERFDIRTAAEIEEDHRRAFEDLHERVVVYNAMQRSVGTLNHVQQGLSGAVL